MMKALHPNLTMSLSCRRCDRGTGGAKEALPCRDGRSRVDSWSWRPSIPCELSVSTTVAAAGWVGAFGAANAKDVPWVRLLGGSRLVST